MRFQLLPMIHFPDSVSESIDYGQSLTTVVEQEITEGSDSDAAITGQPLSTRQGEQRATTGGSKLLQTIRPGVSWPLAPVLIPHRIEGETEPTQLTVKITEIVTDLNQITSFFSSADVVKQS